MSTAAAPSRVLPEATVSFVAAIGGTVDAIAGQVDVELSPLRIGPTTLPASRVQVVLEPVPSKKPGPGLTVCGHPQSIPFDPKAQPEDTPDGIIHVTGSLFGGQLSLDDIQITEQRAAMLSGTASLKDLDLGALANLLPGVAFSGMAPSGKLSATVHIDELPLQNPGLAEVRVIMRQLDVERGGNHLHMDAVAEPIVLSGDVLRLPDLPFVARLGTGLNARLTAGGTIDNLSSKPQLHVGIKLDTMDLGALGVGLPGTDDAKGLVNAELKLGGPVSDPTLSGGLEINQGMVRIKGFAQTIENIHVKVLVSPSEIEVAEATAQVGSTGKLSLKARVPLRGFQITGASATLEARGIKLPIADGIRLTADASLGASYTAALEGSAKQLPNITGTVTLTSFTYSRPMSFMVDVSQLANRAPTEIESYDPRDDVFSFDINVISPEALALRNNVLDMEFELAQPGLELFGTNQRFGARGGLRVIPGGKLMLQGHDFTIGDGTVSFDNPARITPRLDVRATTEYRRYAQSAQADTTTSAAATPAAAGTSGKWRIEMHATGDTDAPEVRFTSDPALSQEDIVLLLQIGMTRAELDRATTGALAQSVGLEALTTATGLDQAVRSTVPLIDEFRISSQYSSRTGRTEPTATVGKRVTEDVRASVTTGLTDNSEIRSNLEWRLGKGLSVEGSYDNVNDVSASGIGNLGADLRWHIEFE